MPGGSEAASSSEFQACEAGIRNNIRPNEKLGGRPLPSYMKQTMTMPTPAPSSIRPPVARFGLGEVVRHRLLDFRGVIFDVDPEFANSDEWYEAIPEEMRPAKEQPFYHLLAENADSGYVAYVSQQNLVPDEDRDEVDHPAIGTLFDGFDGTRYRLKPAHRH